MTVFFAFHNPKLLQFTSPYSAFEIKKDSFHDKIAAKNRQKIIIRKKANRLIFLTCSYSLVSTVNFVSFGKLK